MLKINELARLYLGVKQENESRTILIDMSAWAELYPNATAEILHKRWGDETKDLTGATYDSDTKILSWTPTSYDTFYDGFGMAEIRMVEGDVVKKTKDLITTAVSPSITGGSGEIIESDFQAWLNTVIGYKNDTVTAKNAAKGYKEDSEAYAVGKRNGTDVESTDPAYENNAKYFAALAAALISVADVACAEAITLAAGSSATVEIQTTENGKKFVFGIPKGPKGDPGSGSAGVNGIKMNGSEVTVDDNGVAQLGDVVTDKTDKADKVSSPTENNFAALDANGNLKDSGHKHSDYLTQHQDISGKADKATGATENNFAALDANGNPIDSGHKHSDYLTAHQDISGKKNTQSAVSDPTASGNAVEFISGITQNEQGVISPVKKTVQSATTSQSGLMSAADKTLLGKLPADIAIVEDDDNNLALHNITKGSYVVWKGVLKKASAAISIGDTLSSSNLSNVSNGLGGVLKSLDDKIVAYDTFSSTSCTVNSSAAIASKSNIVIKIGRLVIVAIGAEVTGSVASGTVLYTVPSGYRPSANRDAVAGYIDRNGNISYIFGSFQVGSDGKIKQTISGSWSSGGFTALFIYYV